MSQMGQKRTSGVHFCNVRFTPKSGHRRVRSPCPFSADITSRPRAVDIMNTQELAKAFTDLCAKGELEAAGKKIWSDDIVSREPMTGDMAELKGRKAVEGKTQWWNANHEVHDLKVEGPYVHGDQFVVRFKLDVTPKGQNRIHLDEVGLYTVRNNRIVEESFFMGGR